MKTLAIATVILGTASIAAAQPAVLRGSDTLFGATTDAINVAGLSGDLSYAGGGSGLGETGLRNGTQGIAPMSREISAAGQDDLLNQGVFPVQTVIGLDGVSVFVQAGAPGQIDIPTIRGIYTCAITSWDSIPGSGKTGQIKAFRRDDVSGTTDVFKSLVGISTFGSCVTVLASTSDIADVTSTDASAIGYSGLSGSRPGHNQELSVGRTSAGPFVAPNENTIRNFSYPLARRLYINSVSEGRVPSVAEQALLDFMSNPDNMDPILVANEFVTCDRTTGCP